MYYKIDVFSNTNVAMKESYLYKDNDPKVDCDVLKLIVKKTLRNPYGVRVTTTKHKHHRKVRSWSELENELRDLKFYEMKSHIVEDYACYATFYGEKPFDIENEYFMGKHYSFFKRPGKYTTSIWTTLVEILDAIWPEPHISKNGDPFVADKYILTNDGLGHWNLLRLMGTHTEYKKQELYY